MSDAAFVAISAANSAAAQAAADEAARQACIVTMHGFRDEGATVEEKQAYAECVNRVYPQELSGSDAILMKVFIVLALVGAAIGVWWGLRDDDQPLTTILGFVLGGLILPMAGLIVLAICAGIKFLFS